MTERVPAIRPRYTIRVRGGTRVLGLRTWLMGVVNVTPDSFSDGGRFSQPEQAVARGLALFEQGADVVDVGGESTRPGGAPVAAEVEVARVVPVIAGLRERGPGLVSVDTTKARVAKAALDTGADLVNDVSGLLFDPALGPVVAAAGVPLVLMHLRGSFTTMHAAPAYGDLAAELCGELSAALARAVSAGVDPEQTLLDPGLGFSKDASHSLSALAQLGRLHALGRPLLVGPSRKSFIGKLTGAGPEARQFGTAAAVAAAILQGAHVVRVHDVAEMAQVAQVADALLEARA